MKCSACGQEMPVKVGDIVEIVKYNDTWKGSIGVVTAGPTTADEFYEITLFAGFRKGDKTRWRPHHMCVVHGYIHIDRGRPCASAEDDYNY